jgi:endonuclease/exonuclease/phosphatase family metal-dependent hydrolase
MQPRARPRAQASRSGAAGLADAAQGREIVGTGHHLAGGDTRSPATLRVMTFNLLTSTQLRRSHPWRLRKRSVARIFREYAPDVVGTQEANLAQLRELAELLPEYDFVGEGNLSRTDLSDSVHNWYCAIFYRRDRVRPAEDESDTWWLSPTPGVPASRFAPGTRPRVATWQTFELLGGGQPFVMGTTHLEAFSGLSRRRSALALRDYVTARVRQLGDDTPLFLTGDFNAADNSRELRTLADGGRRDTALHRLAIGRDARAGGGRHLPRPRIVPRRQAGPARCAPHRLCAVPAPARGGAGRADRLRPVLRARKGPAVRPFPRRGRFPPALRGAGPRGEVVAARGVDPRGDRNPGSRNRPAVRIFIGVPGCGFRALFPRDAA